MNVCQEDWDGGEGLNKDKNECFTTEDTFQRTTWQCTVCLIVDANHILLSYTLIFRSELGNSFDTLLYTVKQLMSFKGETGGSSA